jgi:flagellar biosynthesis protein FlhG
MQNAMPHIWTIGGGKGGTGKSFFTGSLGFLLAAQGCKTLLIDLDLGAANLHTIVGLPHPEKSIADFIHKRVATLEETVVATPHPNLSLISGAMNNLDMPNLAHEQKQKLLRNLTGLPYEYILLDLGAGTAYNTIDFFLIADVGIFITTPEPTAIENIYRLIRSVYFRKIHQVLKTYDFKALAGEAEQQNPLATVSNPDLLLPIIARLDPAKGAILEEALGAFEFKLAVNQLRKQDSPNIGMLICKIIGKHLGLKMQPIGNVGFDDRVHYAVCKKRPFLELYPYTPTALDLRECCRFLLAANPSSPVLRKVME